MRYVDGFLIPVPKKNLRAYRRNAQAAGRIWKKMGALEYCETVGEDLAQGNIVPFTKASKAKPSETVIFSWIVYRSRADRDRVNARVLMDPVILKMMKAKSPFDVKRMVYGGFRMLVDM